MAHVQTRTVADKASLSDLRRSLRHELAAAGVPDPITFDCLVAVTEMWSRSAPLPTDPAPEVRWDITPAEARFYIQGGGSEQACKASHPSRAASAPLDVAVATLDEASIALVTGLMDGVRVTDGPSGRTVCLTKSL